MQCRTALVGALALLLLLHGPALMSAAWTNAGMLVLRDALLAQVESVSGAYPVHGALRGDAAIAQAMRYLRRAVALNRDGPAARWGLGRAALAAGDAETAADALEPLAGSAERNPLLYDDVLMALSYSGRPEEVIALYESAPPLQRTGAISDVVALAYLDLVTGGLGDERTGGQGEVGQWLERSNALRPGDLYASYHLWRQARERGDMEAATVYSETLAYFPLEAVHLTDERLLGYAADVIPVLVEEGLWDREKTLNVVSFLVWQHNEAAGTEWLLEQLIERYPTDPDWPFYLAELYHRRGDLDQAEAVYRQTLMVDPEYVQAYLRLGMVTEAQSQNPSPRSQEWLAAAEEWYAQYHAVARDDLLGLKRLAEVCTALQDARVESESCQEAALQEALEARADDRRIVAEWLGVPVEGVALGPNLVENGRFEEGQEGQLERWYFQTYLGPGKEGLYFAGPDALAGEGNAARIIGLRGGLMDDGTATYGELVGEELTLSPGGWYVISARYRTQNLSGNGLLFLGEWFKPDGVRLTHTYLEDSSGEWRQVSILVRGQDWKMAVVPLVRNWALGSVWFDDLQVRPIWSLETTILDAEGNEERKQ
jgi:tetratricopeptide (TPR) repeat protein